MKNLLLLVCTFLLFFLQEINAQVPSWEWARTGGYDEGQFISTDLNENVYLAGNVLVPGLNSFGNIPFSCNAINGCSFIVKYDSSGNTIWFKGQTPLGSGDCIISALIADPFGNIYISGSYTDTVIFDYDTLISNNFSSFIAKYNSSGNVLWVKTLTNNGYFSIKGLASGYGGKIYATGIFTSTQILGPDTLYSSGSQDCFTFKSDSAGNILWAKSANGLTNGGKSIAVDKSENVYVTGSFGSTSLLFGSYTLPNTIIGTGSVPFLAKYDSSGNFAWVRIGVAYNNSNYAVSVATDPSDNVYVGGLFNDNAIIFDSIPLIKTYGGSNAFIVKYDSSGNIHWAKSIKAIGTGNVGSTCVATDHFGRIYLTGFFGTPPYNFNTTGAIFDTIHLYHSIDDYDPMFIACYDKYGNVIFAKKLSSGGDDDNSISTGPSGAAYIGGDYVTNPNTTFIIGNDTFPESPNGEKPFLTKLIYNAIIEDINSTSGINSTSPVVFPNPFDNEIKVQVNDICELCLMDLTSRVLFRKYINDLTTIDSSSLPSGFYILRIKNKKDEIISLKIFKQ